MNEIKKITIPQFDLYNGGLYLSKYFIYISSGLISLTGLYGALSGNIKGMNFIDGVLVVGLGLFFALVGYLYFRFALDNLKVNLYTDKIELLTKNGKLKKCFDKEKILFIASIVQIPGRSRQIYHIPFDVMEEAKRDLSTYMIYIETEIDFDLTFKPKLNSKKSIFFHKNKEAIRWLHKYYADKIKNPPGQSQH